MAIAYNKKLDSAAMRIPIIVIIMIQFDQMYEPKICGYRIRHRFQISSARICCYSFLFYSRDMLL